MDFKKYIFSRGLPKTGQETEYKPADDGAYEVGWWRKRLNANNRTRFIVKTIAGDVVVFDRATGLMWAGDGDEAGCNNGVGIKWTDALSYAIGLTFAGFNDWRMPNAKELMSIVNYGVDAPPIDDPPFEHTGELYYLTSTTYRAGVSQEYAIDFRDGTLGLIYKSASVRVRLVRLGV